MTRCLTAKKLSKSMSGPTIKTGLSSGKYTYILLDLLTFEIVNCVTRPLRSTHPCKNMQESTIKKSPIPATMMAADRHFLR